MSDLMTGDIVEFDSLGLCYIKTAMFIRQLDEKCMLIVMPKNNTNAFTTIWLPYHKLKTTGKNIFVILKQMPLIIKSLDWMTKTIQYQQTQTGIDSQPSKELTEAIELLEALKA